MSESEVGLANPYALAELALGRKVNWKSITDHEAFIRKTLGMSIDELCAPAAGNLKSVPSIGRDCHAAEMQIRVPTGKGEHK